jgi:hypothetical protein
MPVSKPRILDLFCGAGGCTKGYQRAGFYVVGVDNRPQPNYCGDEFVQADALSFGDPGLLRFDAVHASPPCQDFLNLSALNRALGRDIDHPRLIATVREKLLVSGLPYVIENVCDARPELRAPIRLCGSSFGLAVRRHRLFESNVPIMALPCAHHLQREARFWTSVRPLGKPRLSSVVQVYGNGGGSDRWAEAMGIDWMTKTELRQAIPPAYTEHIGHYLLAEIKARAAA